jgi:hypothetical protein
MFAIETATEFLEKVKSDLASLEADIADLGRAMNCILSGYHLHEWVWAHWLKAEAPRLIRGTMIRSRSDFVEWLAENSPHFELLQELASGSKHCSPVHSTQVG